MITIILKNGQIERFNLKNHEREQALHDAWYSMSDMPGCANKEFIINTDLGNKIQIRVKEIESVKFEASEYIKVTASDIH